jgi:hypothetical protein
MPKPLSDMGFVGLPTLSGRQQGFGREGAISQSKKEAARVHAFDPLLLVFSTRPMPYALGLRRVSSWRAG